MLTKVTYKETGRVDFLLTTKCKKCNCDIVVPEVYFRWVVRTFGLSIPEIEVKCIDCGGPRLNRDTYYNIGYWENSVLRKETVQEQSLNTTYPLSYYSKDWRDGFDDWPHHAYGHSSYNGPYTFMGAYEKLKKFIVKENADGQHETMEHS